MDFIVSLIVNTQMESISSHRLIDCKQFHGQLFPNET